MSSQIDNIANKMENIASQKVDNIAHKIDAGSQKIENQKIILPNQFQLKQNFVSLRKRITVEYDGNVLGDFHKVMMAKGTVFNFDDKDGNTIAFCTKTSKADDDAASYEIARKEGGGSTYEICEQPVDNASIMVGVIYEIKKDGKLVAKCQKTDLLHQSVSVIPISGAGSAAFQKNYLGVKDTWKVSVSDDFIVESYVVGFFAAIIQIDSE